MRLPEGFVRPGWSIVHLEMVCVILSCVVWGPSWSGTCVTLACDNEAVVNVVNSFRASDVSLQAMNRKLCFLQAKMNFKLKLRFWSSRQNEQADILSRSHLSPSHAKCCDNMIADRGLKEVIVDPTWLKLEDHW